jgi:outer membrane receptor protein involved in Fe transport
MVYRGQSSFTTDQPVSAYQQGLIGRYGTLDPTDGGFSERFSLSGHHVISGDDWKLTTGAYVIHSRLTLWNDFTHYLVDPVHGDQEQQDETRTTFGGQTIYSRADEVVGLPVETEIGLQGRYDTAFIDRRHTQARVVQPNCPDSPNGGGLYVCNADNVTLGNVGAYVQNTTHWLPWFRTVASLREDDDGGADHSLVSGYRGSINKTLLEPKGSLIFGPWAKTEFYISGGRGFHSNDLRGVLGTVPSLGVGNPNQATPLLTKIVSEEVGLRSNMLPRTQLTAALFRVDFDSFLTYDADNGVDNAGPPARLQGIELSAQYRPYDWIELSADLNFTHSRYRTGDPAAYGVPGLYIPNAPNFIGSFGAIVDNLGPWFGGVEMRWLGGYPLVEDNSLRSSGYKEINLDVGYKINEKMKIQISVFNLFNTHAAASQYAYEYQVSPTAAPQFGATYHPLEPLSARFALTALF